MKSIKVYRLENSAGLGPYRGGHRMEAEQLKQICNPIHGDDRLSERRKKSLYKSGWKYGWDSESIFDNWMNGKEGFFASLGYNKVCYIVNKYRKYDKQYLGYYDNELEDYVDDLFPGCQVFFKL